ncbi:hypothetical protein SAMN05444266_11655 [Chitinophaga jiangningensis]|uniref:Uncharacterized protein n=1 Tax=Chitinophaga jiangningensis TaxID=1419482 RepID=A0A1M7N452_9BACT|nr:hypothetical protein [Chitinophaga jiangningensis]SHM98249.1 hypothetical protein SAMN05444266_11655 [Chitinophaga jiangningensis]
MLRNFLLLTALAVASGNLLAQQTDKTYFTPTDTANGYYMAVKPNGPVKGAVVVFGSYAPPESFLPETKLHNVAAANNLLTVYASLQLQFYATPQVTARMDSVLNDVVKRYGVPADKFALGAYGDPGIAVFRYAEMMVKDPSRAPVSIKALFGADCRLDLLGTWERSNAAIRINFFPGSVGDAKFYTAHMRENIGTPDKARLKFSELTPLDIRNDSTGNEKYLKDMPVRLYYDTDISWYLQHRRFSVQETNMAEGAELIKRLLLLGNKDASFVPALAPGMRSNGVRTPAAWSVIDEVDCIHWVKNKLNIFDPVTYKPPYFLPAPKDWATELIPFPIEFAPEINYKGMEDIRFAPGWGDKDSEEYWSYVILWWLEAGAATGLNDIKTALESYYKGLVGRNIGPRNIPSDKLIPVTVSLKPVSAAGSKDLVYEGTVKMLDYMTQLPMALHTRVIVGDCEQEKHKRVFIELSPRPFGHKVWSGLEAVRKGFKCSR